MKIISLGIFVIAILYSAVAFTTWTINPGEWDEVGRAFVAFLVIVVIGAVVMALLDEDIR